MPLRVLIVQPDSQSARPLADFFAARGDQVWQTTAASEAQALMEQHQPGLAVVDLHLPEDGWQVVLQDVRQKFPEVKVLLTTRYHDPSRELRAKAQGASVFLRPPFTPARIEDGLRQLEGGIQPALALEGDLPKVRVPVRAKITFPYVLLALLFALAGAYLVNRVALDNIEVRFFTQLAEAGRLTADQMVQEENRLLETLRLLANIQGMPQAIGEGDVARLRDVALPIAVNQRAEAIDLLDRQGLSLLSLRHRSGGDVADYDTSDGQDFAPWAFVRYVLERRSDEGRDKHIGLVRGPGGDYFYVAGPVVDEGGGLAGVILVGKSLPTLANQIRRDTRALTSLYEVNGELLVSTLPLPVPLDPEQVALVLERQDQESLTRDLTAVGSRYTEIVGPWEARGGDDLGLIGTSLPQAQLVNLSQFTRFQIFVLVTSAFLLVIAVGVYLANQITRPLLQVTYASTDVAQGNLEVKVDPIGHDEVAILAHSFNYMVSRLREGSIYRDLLGRAVSPEVREQLHLSFTSGDVRLEGQEVTATVLIADIRNFTGLSETVGPTMVLTWLNEYFGALVPIITSHGGVVNHFAGDAVLAFFGILPRLLPAAESAQRACRATVEMLRAIDRLNAQRRARGEPPFVTGIGVNTGLVTAGGLGTLDRLHYTIIGDTVNTTQRLENLTQQFGESSAVVSAHTVTALGAQPKPFHLEQVGMHNFRGKSAEILVYRLWPDAREAQEQV